MELEFAYVVSSDLVQEVRVHGRTEGDLEL